jgi:hypothetical protein
MGDIVGGCLDMNRKVRAASRGGGDPLLIIKKKKIIINIMHQLQIFNSELVG